MKHAARLVLAVLVVFSMAAFLRAQDSVTVPRKLVTYPSLIVYNGKIVTMDDESTTTNLGAIVEAMAIRGDEIFEIGSNDEVLALAGPDTERIDLGGHTVIPGIIDSHTHIHNREVQNWIEDNPEIVDRYSRLFFIGGKTDEEITRGIEVTLKENMGGAPEGQWAFLYLNTNDGGSGMGPGVKYVQDHKMALSYLNSLSPEVPVFIAAHPAYMINDAAKQAIVDLYGFEPPMGENEEMDENQQGGLVLYGRALVVDGYFKDHIPELADVVQDGLQKNAAVGITTFTSHLMGLRFMDAYRLLESQGRMPIRFAYTHYFGFQNNPDPASFYRRLGDMAGMGSDYFWTTGVGVGNIDDGPPMFCSSIPTRPEIKKREYCKNAPGTSQGEGIYAALVSRERVSLGHAYADRGVDYFMDAIEKAMREEPSITLDYVRSRRFSSDHCGLYPRPDQIPRMARLGMIISCGGNVLDRTYPWLELYGMQYQKWISPIRSLLEGGVRVVFENEAGVRGTNSTTYFYDVVPLLTRKNHRGYMVAPDESVEREILMKMMTSWPSYYMLREDRIGTLEPGKLADFLVLNQDYFTVQPVEEIANTYPLMTVVGGKVVFLHEDYAPELGKQPVGIQITYENKPAYDY